MRISIFAKIFLFHAILVFAFFVLLSYFALNTIKDYYIDSLTTQLTNFESALAPKITALLHDAHFENLDAFTKQLGKDTSIRITVINPQGIVIADSIENPASMENHKGRPEISDALSGSKGTSLRYSTSVQEEMLYVAIPLKEDNKIIGVLRASFFLKDINKFLNDLNRKFAFIILSLALVSLLATLLFSRFLTKPIKELVNASRAIGEGNFDVRLFFKQKNELKELADSYNTMASHMQTLFSELSQQKEELNNLIASIQDCLVVIDEKGTITLCNESFKKMVQNEMLEQKLCWEVLRNADFDDLIKKTWAKKINLIKEIEFNDKFYLCSTSLLTLKKEIAILFHDITQIKNLEKLKKDLIDNVSHELRTPLTAIKGFVDTLQEDTTEKNKHYLDIISRHADRLINIVRDLLSLSHLEAKETILFKEEVNLKILIVDLLPLFQQRATDKSLNLVLELPELPSVIKGDTFKLEQMFINLIDNAINYTEKGEIRISIQTIENFIRIEIKDTGIGIPSEHLPRIFDRFYVVDKSRSRKYSGTGLGLSIVKHIVLLHNGEIHVTSSPSGTTFTITLPRS